jgi:hypothetical protein
MVLDADRAEPLAGSRLCAAVVLMAFFDVTTL